MKNRIEAIIFDMDGTIYQIDGKPDGYNGSSLERQVSANVLKLIMDQELCGVDEASAILELAKNSSESLSNFFARRYNITKSQYFDTVWTVDPSSIVQNAEIAIQVIKEAYELGLIIVLLTSAPAVWQQAVIKHLKLSGFFSEIFTADDPGFSSKEEIFSQLATRFKSVLSVGDQFETDIFPAQKFGISTIHVKSPEDLMTVLDLIR
jgi:FMN phosphatase YigB (HAD superfamily)